MSEGSWGVLGVLWGSVAGQESLGRGGEVLGRFQESFMFFFIEVKLAMVQRHIHVFSWGSFCEALGCFWIMFLFFCVSKLLLLRNSDLNMLQIQ